MFSLAVRAGKLTSRPPITLLAEENVREGFHRPAGVHAAPCAAPRAQGPGRGRRGGVRLSDVPPAWQRARGAVVLVHACGSRTAGYRRQRAPSGRRHEKQAPAAAGADGATPRRSWRVGGHSGLLNAHTCFTATGARSATSGPPGWPRARPSALPGLLFHDLKRSGARNYRRAQVTEDVIMRIGGWKTPSMFRRYNVVDERDLTEAAERLAGFLTDAASAPPTIVPLAASAETRPAGSPPVSSRRLHGQNTDNRGTPAIAPPATTAVSS